MKNDNTGLACLGLFVIAVVGVVFGAIIQGWVLSILWGWFVVPVFNIPNLTIATAIGLALVAGMLVNQSSNSDSKSKDTGTVLAEMVGRAMVAPLITLGVGWIIKLFV